ncbi:2'-5' RNA ligase family protein [Streptomyces subrutilus]|uniref:2'-5' RNA ligase family protein n=1 Tax=Streptomyces subrutilus TaxID=36818 RepID=UPI00114CE823|nr:2'-5' RNA ligase family protein [Streptomyces subrutilus]
MTGVVDEVNDLIMPGAFTATLATRPVKTVWHHEWKDPVGVVLDVTELLPGNKLLTAIPGWPAEAGALVATVAYNLRTSRGRDAYEQVKQWHEHKQAQFSIGYRVPQSGATRRSDGVRVIHTLDLFEVSPVLHGAHPMTRALEVKADPGTAGLERKETRSAVLEVKAAEQQINRGVMVALYPPPAVAERIAHAEGSPPAELHVTLAYLGDADQLPGHPDDLTHIVQMALSGVGPLTGSIGGIGRFPDHGSGIPTWVPVDVPGLAEVRQRIVDGLASHYDGVLRTNHGFVPHLTLGYDLPDVPDVPSLPVDFSAVHVVRGADRIPIWLQAETEKDAEPSAEMQQFAAAAADSSRVPAGEQKSARAAVAAARARRTPRIEHKSARAIVAEAKSRITFGETPMTTTPQALPESYEQLRSRLADSVRELLGKDDGSWTCIEATYPDRVIVSVNGDGPGPSSTFAIPYQTAGGSITLGTPQPVELATIVVPEGTSAHRAATTDEDVDARVVQPTVDALTDATARITATTAKPDQLEAVRATVSSLVAALSAKGLAIDPDPEELSGRPGDTGMALWDDDTFEDDDLDAEDDEDHAPASEAPETDGADTGQGTIRLDPDEVKAALAAIQL